MPTVNNPYSTTYGSIKLDGEAKIPQSESPLIFDQCDALYSNSEAVLVQARAYIKANFPKVELEEIFQSHSPWEYCLPINTLTPAQVASLHKWAKGKFSKVVDQ